jgi:hypothetical protein
MNQHDPFVYCGLACALLLIGGCWQFGDNHIQRCVCLKESKSSAESMAATGRDIVLVKFFI